MSELPSGAVTFLFTDIEGSTGLVKRLRDRYDDVLADHQRLLRAAFEAHRGHEVDTQGDSFFVAFSSARDALLAAIDGQLALLAHPGRRARRSRSGWGCTPGRRVPQTAATPGSRCIARRASAPPAMAARSSCPRPRRPCSRTRRTTRTSSCVTSVSSGSRISIARCGSTRRARTGCRSRSRRPRGEAPLAEAAAGRARAAVLASAEVPRRCRTRSRRGSSVAAVYLVTRDSTGGLDAVQPNHVGLIDPKTNRDRGRGSGRAGSRRHHDRRRERVGGERRLRPVRVADRPTCARTSERRSPSPPRRPGWPSRQATCGRCTDCSARCRVSVPSSTGRVGEPIDVGVGRTSAGSIAAGASGLWVAFAGQTTAYVGRIEPASGTIGVSGSSGGDPRRSRWDDDAVWVANGIDSSTISRLDPATAE